MRLLLDESLPVRLLRHLPEHQVSTVVREGWGGVRNGQLLALASRQFEAFITADQNLRHQQNLHTLPVAVVVLESRSNELAALLPLLPALNDALSRLVPRSLVIVRSGD